MTSRNGFVFGAAVALAVGALAVDLSVPLGYATGVLHLVPLLVVGWSRVRWQVVVVTAVSSAFVVADIFAGRAAAALPVVLVNRALTLGVLWVAFAMMLAQLRARAERQAADARAAGLFARIVAAAPDGMLVVRPPGVVSLANPAAERIFGFGAGELAGRAVEDLVPPAQRAPHQRLAHAFFQRPEARALMAGRAVTGLRKDGTEVALEVVLTPFDDQGACVLAAIRDMTERRLLEERLRATQRMEAIGKLAAGIAHDFNNMLAAILGNASLALGGVAAGSSAAEDLEEVIRASRRAAELTGQLLAFSRRQIIEPRPTNVNELVRELRKMLERLVGSSIRFSTHLHEGLWTVKVDPSQLEQVLLNLVVNARDAMPDGGQLTLETGNATLDAAYARMHPDVEPGEYTMLAITDTGTGMPPEVRVRIFEPFFSTKQPGRGTGLGLATTYGIVKQAGGHIWVYSEPGQGTTFKVYLPRVRLAAEPVATARAEPSLRGGTETVLIADDETPLRRVLVRTLRAAGYTVIEAGNGEEALLKLEQWDGGLDLLITDVVMPQMGGRELAARLAARHPGVRVLYSSGYTENAIVHDSRLEAGIAFLQKPFTPDEFLRRVRRVLDDQRQG